MIALVVVAMAAGWATTVAVLVRSHRSQQRDHARREDLLVNQLLHAAGKPWQGSPAEREQRFVDLHTEEERLVNPDLGFQL